MITRAYHYLAVSYDIYCIVLLGLERILCFPTALPLPPRELAVGRHSQPDLTASKRSSCVETGKVAAASRGWNPERKSRRRLFHFEFRRGARLIDHCLGANGAGIGARPGSESGTSGGLCSRDVAA